MASVASASPSGHSYQRDESNEDSESWQYVDSNPASVFFPSPGSSSMNSTGWVVGGYPNVERSPAAVSPLQLDDSQIAYSAPPSFPDQQSDPASIMAAASGIDNPFLSSFPGDQQSQFITDQDFLFPGPFDRMSAPG